MKETIKKHSVKITVGTVVAVALFIVYTTINLMGVKSEMDVKQKECATEIAHISGDLIKMDDRVEDLEDSNVDIQVRLASIDTKLISIESLLIDLKKTLDDTDK
jgi:septal ring factor EnvC (AmiA/AmiB activator)